jgi:acyl-coenzyme A synthetase/AMP-(fatty) acid ligase
MLRGIYRDPQRYQAQYWDRYPGIYFTGDGAKVDDDGYFWLLGRVDDVMNISGHRVSTMEVESALVDHPLVAEAAVIGRPHEIKGQAIAAFVTIRDGNKGTKELMEEIKAHVTKKIGSWRATTSSSLRFAEDPQRQDHAPTPARHRRGQGAGRHDRWPTAVVARLKDSTARKSRTRKSRKATPASRGA